MLRKRCTRAISLALVMGMLLECAVPCNGDTLCKRTIEVEDYSSSERYTSEFDVCSVEYDEDSNRVDAEASASFTEKDVVLFDLVSLTEDVDGEEGVAEVESSEELEEIVISEGTEDLADEYWYGDGSTQESLNFDDLVLEDAQVEYECSFDMEELVFEFKAELVAEDGQVLDSEEIVTDAIITENGGLDAKIEIDGETYLMSDYEGTSSVDNCSIASTLNIISIYLAVAEVAEQVKARSNYKYNKKLEEDGKGVGKGYYITDQSESSVKNKKSANYRFGFTTFKNVGCEVAAAYNLVLDLGDSMRLSETIMFFEYYLIEFSVGWGKLGSNPLEMYRFLKKLGYSYSKYTNYSNFKKAVAKKTNCKIIMSRWNDPVTTGLHTFYIKKTGNTYYGYNWEYYSRCKDRKSLDDFNNGSGFIVGYIVWK